MNKELFMELSKNNFKPLTFYNMKMSTISFEISVDGKLQINIAKALDPSRSKRPTKGENLYDHENRVHFSLSVAECFDVASSLGSVLKGTYTNPNEKDERFKHNLIITHFRDNSSSRIVFEQNKNDHYPTSVKVTIFPTKNSGSPVSYVFKPNELSIVSSLIKMCALELPFYSLFTKSIIKTINKSIFALSNNNDNKDSKPSYNKNYNKTSNNNSGAKTVQAEPEVDDTSYDNNDDDDEYYIHGSEYDIDDSLVF